MRKARKSGVSEGLLRFYVVIKPYPRLQLLKEISRVISFSFLEKRAEITGNESEGQRAGNQERRKLVLCGPSPNCRQVLRSQHCWHHLRDGLKKAGMPLHTHTRTLHFH